MPGLAKGSDWAAVLGGQRLVEAACYLYIDVVVNDTGFVVLDGMVQRTAVIRLVEQVIDTV